MLIIKLIGACLTIGSSGAIGYYFSLLLKERKTELYELKKIILLLRGDIRFAGTPLPEAVEMLAERQQGCFKHFLETTAQKLKQYEGTSFQEIWKKGVWKELGSTSLLKKDKEELARFGDNLGFLDKEMQLNTIDLYIDHLENEIKEAEQAMKEKTRLYHMLGIMAGAFVTIIIF